MARVVMTAEVENSAKWEEGFRTHGELFKEQTVTAVHFNRTDDNQVTLYFEIDNLAKFMEILESPATDASMSYDGVKRDTVKMYVLDSEFQL